ncbi:unnamed protein product [Auanema sp. JU1783]|nr:unnamed protein product [Auanema sp. JU1783]
MANTMQVTKEEVEAAFALLDPASPNLLKISNLKLVMRGLGFDPRNAQIEGMTKKIKDMKTKTVRGQENPNSIDVDEFLDLLRDTTETDKSLEEMRSAFRLFDKEGKGWISIENLKQVAKELGEDLAIDELNDMIKEASQGKNDGKVKEQDFFDIMKKTCLY